jgi:hypothetical protein
MHKIMHRLCFETRFRFFGYTLSRSYIANLETRVNSWDDFDLGKRKNLVLRRDRVRRTSLHI